MFCRKCGVQIEDNVKECPVCGEAVSCEASSCCAAPTYCGRSKSTMAILAFLFGSLGVHNFLMGEVKKGLMKILLSFVGISYIFAVIDFVKILTDEYKVDPNAFF